MIRAREGARAYKSEAPLILTLEWNTQRHGDRPFEIGHIEELPIELVDSLTGSMSNHVGCAPRILLVVDRGADVF